MKTILIVEDDPLIRSLLTRRLEMDGFKVIIATDGAAGVHRARVDNPSLIIMDIGLPILNGWQATHRIRSMPSTRAIPIIALTAFAMKDDRVKSLAVGCDDFEVKPVDFTQLSQKIERLLSQPRAL
jgi:two-component system, cell cycle response regulator DivK